MKSESSFKIVLVMCIGIFITMLDTTIMNITIPAIQKDLNISLEGISWALNIYTILFAVCSIPLGRLAEIFGRNKVYVIGLVLFGFGSLLCGLSDGSASLITSRAIQSLGAAIIFPTSMVIGVSSVSLAKRNGALALLGMTQGLSAALGPTVGGIIMKFMSWRWVFYVNIPISIIGLALCFWLLRFRKEERLKVSIDWPGLVLSALTILSITLVLVKGNTWGWLSAGAIACYITFPVSLLLFLWAEYKSKYPMVNLKLFKDKQFNATAVTIIISNLFMIAVAVILPSFLTKVEGTSELKAALLVTPMSAMIFVFSPISSLLIKKIKKTLLICLGFAIMSVSYYLLFTLHLDQNHALVIVSCLLLGTGYGIIIGPVTVMAASSFEGELLAASQSVASVLRQIGVVLAVAIYVSTLTHNIDTSKTKIMTYASQKVDAMHVPDAQREAILAQTKQKLDNSGQEAAAQPSDSGSAQQMPPEMAAAMQAFSKDVNAYSHDKIKNAYIDLYRYSFPFVVLSITIGLLFWRRNERSEEERSAVHV